MVNAKVDPALEMVANLAKGKNLVDLREPLEKIFRKKDITFYFSPEPHFAIKYAGGTIGIMNKKYVAVDDSTAVVDDIAIFHV